MEDALKGGFSTLTATLPSLKFCIYRGPSHTGSSLACRRLQPFLCYEPADGQHPDI